MLSFHFMCMWSEVCSSNINTGLHLQSHPPACAAGGRDLQTREFLNKPQQSQRPSLSSVITPPTNKAIKSGSSCRAFESAEWLLTDLSACFFHLFLPRCFMWHIFMDPVTGELVCNLAPFQCKNQWNPNWDSVFHKPWAGQLILRLTVKFACFFIFLIFLHPAGQAAWTTVFALGPITLRAALRASCTSFQRISTNWQQGRLPTLFIMYMWAGWHCCWQEAAREIYSWRQSCLHGCPSNLFPW